MKNPVTGKSRRKELKFKEFFLVLSLCALIYPFKVSASEEYKLESLTVTADKREENIQEVPIAVTAFTETELEDAGVETIGDVIEIIPGLTLDTSGMYNASYRGMGVSTLTGKNPVVIFVDGIPFDNALFYDLDLLNIERIEVLRGPQGTLYGKNAIGGVINVISKKPGDSVQGKITTEIAEDETYGVKAFVNGPVIKDKLNMSLSAKHRETNGFLKNDHPGEDHFGEYEINNINLALNWFASEKLEIGFNAGLVEKNNGSSNTIYSDDIKYHENRNPDDKNDSDLLNAALKINYKSDLAEINSITTIRNSENDHLEDRNGSVQTFRLVDTDIFTQELRVQSPENKGRLKWIAGLYYSNENNDSKKAGSFYYPYNIIKDCPVEETEEAAALFGQMTIPFTGSIKFTAGLRYEKIHKELDYKSSVKTIDTGMLISSAEWNRYEDWDALLPRGILSWQINKDLMTYISISKGYLAGGLNNYGDDKDAAKFDEQTSLNYELGTKTSWFDDRLFLNASVFYVDIEDMHVWSSPDNNDILIADNAGEAHCRGIEIEAKARPFNGFDLNASVALTESEFDEYGEFSGNKTLQTPEYTYYFSAQYRHSSGLYIRGEIEGYGTTYYDDANQYKRSPYKLCNTKLGYETPNWDVYLYVDNLLDEEYFSSRTFGLYAVGPPRTMGITASIRF